MDQVEQRMANQDRIDIDQHVPVRLLEDHVVLFADGLMEEGDGIPHQIIDRDRLRLGAGDLVEAQQALDKIAALGARLPHGDKQAPRALGDFRIALGDLGQIDDADQGIIDLVRNLADDLAHGRQLLQLHDALMLRGQFGELQFGRLLPAVNEGKQLEERGKQDDAADADDHPQQIQTVPNGFVQFQRGTVERQHSNDFGIRPENRRIDLDRFRIRRPLLENVAIGARRIEHGAHLSLHCPLQVFAVRGALCPDQGGIVGPDDDVVAVEDFDELGSREPLQNGEREHKARLCPSIGVMLHVGGRHRMFEGERVHHVVHDHRLAIDDRLAEEWGLGQSGRSHHRHDHEQADNREYSWRCRYIQHFRPRQQAA